MRAPLAIEYTSAPGYVWRSAFATLGSVSTSVAMGWGWTFLMARLTDGPAAQSWLLCYGLACLLGLIVFAFLWSPRFFRGGVHQERRLGWDGQDWVLWPLAPSMDCGDVGASNVGTQVEQRGHAALMLDFGAWMLVRFTPTVGRATWLPLDAARDIGRWPALRGALWAAHAGRP